MDIQTAIQLADAYLMKTYRRAPVAFASGQGAYLTDLTGKRYLDFVGGIAVNVLGYNHPTLVSALQAQVARLLHVSNLYHIPEQALLAQWLVEHSACSRVFFCNSGAEANEAAIKLARKYGKRAGTEKFEILVAEHSFHGRTLAALAATAQPKYQYGFEPLPQGFTTVPFNDIEALRAAVSASTCAVMLEPVQGEGGVIPAQPGYLQEVRRLCDDHELLLILDEVQTGIGRTGKMFAYEHFGIEPDILTLAKALGGGVPIGAMLAKAEVAEAFQPGDHGATFGGNPLACAAALAVVRTVVNEGLVARAADIGGYLMNQLRALAQKHSEIVRVRGLGLMVAAELNREAAPIVDACRERGLLVNAVQPTALRFVPPLVIGRAEVEEAIKILDAALEAVGHLTVSKRS